MALFSCKKYEEDKFFSTYTVKSRLEKGGNWSIYEVEDLVLNKKFIPIENYEGAFDFEKSTFSLSSGMSTNYTQFLKPTLINNMSVNTDSIKISQSAFELSSDKNKLLLKDFFAFGYYINPQFTAQGISIREYIDAEFVINKLEFGYMTLSYNDRLIFRLKKIKSE